MAAALGKGVGLGRGSSGETQRPSPDALTVSLIADVL
jgi:hypothetical protein